LKIIYLGSPDFAVLPLKRLIENGYNVVAVITNKDKPFGRKQILTPPPVKTVAIENKIPVLQYDKIRNEGVEDLKKLAPDIMITCAFGQILSQEIINIPRLGVINIHASLLPKYRGASPIHFAILNGEKKTGVTIMRTEAGIDTGDIILKRETQIKDDETCGELFERLSIMGAEALIDALPSIIDKTAKFEKQDDGNATYSKIIKKEMAKIDWNNSAENIYNQIRAFNPSPTAFCTYEGDVFKIHSAKVVNFNGEPGKIIKADKELIVGCGNKSLSLLKVQKAGGKAMDICDFLRGNKLAVGEEFI